MNEQLVLFENEEVKVRTDQGETLINLVHTAKCCGLTTTGVNGNLKIRWKTKGVTEKLNKLLGCTDVHQKYKDEIKYILDEIENADDRTQIFMSSWLSKRMAMECSSEKAMAYKNFLATLDEKRENGQLEQISNQQVAQLISTTVQGIVPIMVTEITKQFAPMLGDSKKQVDTMIGLMHDQATIYEEERNELKELIGFHSVNTTRIVNTIKDKLSEELGYTIMANNPNFQKVKRAIFKEFKVFKWEDISVSNYHKVFAFADEFISDLKIAN
jgi:hypothetical protein